MAKFHKVSELKTVLKHIADGFPFVLSTEGGGIYIIVENPDYSPDNGDDPSIVFFVGDE